ncbi:(E)-4-hydroxy-3-methylbut-2-enyl-diphosphate synthase [Ferruginibacter sp. HRS2-29]|uniref:(E)-4-hydroxy-3-methylbut-2-enyl-diphosphate synthase n=1 Tax=Ferruginibacter sp. HRS2-29 TaxID=2487334 RepID=UPI0020CFD7A2|nr:(E)-4-hydroxy-3-methylbut-2-enyl-diphosphate synthase [Ferruginibacter sp. HRS2-29]MCP9752563.1 4-hydroxy-3-methylbut-2-en-1-yl diphosphate synthase [Ferruginibacter sp. HRS2-29]
MQSYCGNLKEYKRLITREVKVGGLVIGGHHPIRVQTMTTTDTMDTEATVQQTIRCIEAGAELVRITAPSKNEAENLKVIKEELHKRGYTTPLVADIHFTPNAAEIAARIVEKVRVNPGNYVDKKKFEQLEYTDAEYAEEIERIRERFTPLVLICKEHGTAMRIGTNHGSLSDRIMSRYGDTANGMVESAMEFLRIARSLDYHQIILSMKSSNPLVMVQAYRLLIQHMMQEFGECYPLHLGVTEAGDGEDGRIKSAIGIGSLLEDGIGDTIRVSLTEDPEFEIPVCKDLVKRYADLPYDEEKKHVVENIKLPYSPFEYQRCKSHEVLNIGSRHVPVVLADFMLAETIAPADLQTIGYTYNEATDKWNIADAAADFIYTSEKILGFNLPGTLQVICDYQSWINAEDHDKYFPLFDKNNFAAAEKRSLKINFISVNISEDSSELLALIKNDHTVVLCIYASARNALQQMRNFVAVLMEQGITCPVIIAVESMHKTVDEQLIHFSATAGGLFLDGMGDGIWLINDPSKMENSQVSGRTYLPTKNNHQFLNNTSFSILQAVRTRISKTEYISCPSCGRTLFDLQETTARIRSVTNHLKGLKIAIMGCIVNGPGEMADADFGYVGSGPGKITLYKGKEVVKKNINSEVAVDELINLLKENDAWIENTV